MEVWSIRRAELEWVAGESRFVSGDGRMSVGLTTHEGDVSLVPERGTGTWDVYVWRLSSPDPEDAGVLALDAGDRGSTKLASGSPPAALVLLQVERTIIPD